MKVKQEQWETHTEQQIETEKIPVWAEGRALDGGADWNLIFIARVPNNNDFVIFGSHGC